MSGWREGFCVLAYVTESMSIFGEWLFIINGFVFTSVFRYGPRAHRHSILRTKNLRKYKIFFSPGRECLSLMGVYKLLIHADVELPQIISNYKWWHNAVAVVRSRQCMYSLCGACN